MRRLEEKWWGFGGWRAEEGREKSDRWEEEEDLHQLDRLFDTWKEPCKGWKGGRDLSRGLRLGASGTKGKERREEETRVSSDSERGEVRTSCLERDR